MGRVCALRLSVAWADPELPALSQTECVSGNLSWSFPKASSGGVPTLPSTLLSPSGLVKPLKLLGLVLRELSAVLLSPSHSPYNFSWGTSAE